MTRLWLTSLLIIALALFSPLLFLPKTDSVEPEPEPVVEPMDEPGEDSDMVFSVLGSDGLFEANMRDYLPGSVSAEMPALFETEALKAQSVAIRTYILNACSTTNPNHPEADVCTSPDCCKGWLSEVQLREKWGDSFEENFSRIDLSVRETDGQLLTYEGQAIQAVFHASSAGKTEDSASIWSDVPYLVSVDSPETEDTVANLVTTVTFTPDELAKLVLVARPGASINASTGSYLGATGRTDSGRVATVTLCEESFSGNEARRALGLRSTNFEATFDGEDYVFTVSGYGHGVGMSQQGANLLAKEGLNYKEILAHYYPGTDLLGTP